jgi:hypothetical protein
MVRKQVYIERRQDQTLKRLARQLSVSEAEVIRRGIELLERECVSSEEERRAAWQRLRALMDKHVRSRPAGSGIEKFDREEVYAERLDKLGRILR